MGDYTYELYCNAEKAKGSYEYLKIYQSDVKSYYIYCIKKNKNNMILHIGEYDIFNELRMSRNEYTKAVKRYGGEHQTVVITREAPLVLRINGYNAKESFNAYQTYFNNYEQALNFLNNYLHPKIIELRLMDINQHLSIRDELPDMIEWSNSDIKKYKQKTFKK